MRKKLVVRRKLRSKPLVTLTPERPLPVFYKKDGRRKYLSAEEKEEERARIEREQEKRKERKRQRYLKKRHDPETIYSSRRSVAKRRNRAFEITLDEFLSRFWKQPCSYCGDPIETAGIDRQDNLLGYLLDNCVPCCPKCNSAKGVQTLEEWYDRMERTLVRVGWIKLVE